ncbi:MAG: glutathione S-transferase family protein [Candidatus Binatia bacterium]
MITLYHAPQTRSVRPRWMLEELGVSYDVRRLNLAAGDQKKPDYLALNPNGTIPTLVDGDLVLWESAAICQYLADKAPDKRLAPPVGTPARGKYYQWIHYAMSALEPPAITIFLHTMMRPEEKRVPLLVEEARPALAAGMAVVERALAGRPHILGDEFTAADVMIASTLGWARMMGLVGADLPNVSDYLDRLMARPAAQRAFAD